ncbi:MAG: hypothetical protein Q8P73_05380 [bacterium]|nr:hypothetical protein [bacterium]
MDDTLARPLRAGCARLKFCRPAVILPRQNNGGDHADKPSDGRQEQKSWRRLLVRYTRALNFRLDSGYFALGKIPE